MTIKRKSKAKGSKVAKPFGTEAERAALMDDAGKASTPAGPFGTFASKPTGLTPEQEASVSKAIEVTAPVHFEVSTQLIEAVAEARARLDQAGDVNSARKAEAVWLRARLDVIEAVLGI